MKKLAYIKLNNQTPKAFGAVLVNTRQDMGKSFISIPASSLSVMVATVSAMSVLRIGESILCCQIQTFQRFNLLTFQRAGSFKKFRKVLKSFDCSC